MGFLIGDIIIAAMFIVGLVLCWQASKEEGR